MGDGTWVDIIFLDMVDFDIIFCFDLVSSYHDILDWSAKIGTLIVPGKRRVEWKGSYRSYPRKVISYMRAQRLIARVFCILLGLYLRYQC